MTHTDIQRYYLCSLEPGLDYAETIISVTDAGLRRFFTTWKGERLTEVAEAHFLWARDGESRSLLELDPAAMRKLEAELSFERTVVAQNPIDPDWADFLPGAAAAHYDAVEETRKASEQETGITCEGFAPADEDGEVTDDDVELMTEIDAVAQVSLAQGIAFMAHRGQTDKLGAAYVDHPGRVAENFDTFDEPIEAASAWLHDVLEDTDVTAAELLEAGVLPEIVEVVELLTRRDGIAPEDYYGAIRQNSFALRVKLADIADNTAPWRVRRLDQDTQERLSQKYHHARQLLLEGDADA